MDVIGAEVLRRVCLEARGLVPPIDRRTTARLLVFEPAGPLGYGSAEIARAMTEFGIRAESFTHIAGISSGGFNAGPRCRR